MSLCVSVCVCVCIQALQAKYQQSVCLRCNQARSIYLSVSMCLQILSSHVGCGRIAGLHYSNPQVRKSAQGDLILDIIGKVI